MRKYKMFRVILAALSLVLANLGFAAETTFYEGTDREGNVSFSDKPSPSVKDQQKITVEYGGTPPTQPAPTTTSATHPADPRYEGLQERNRTLDTRMVAYYQQLNAAKEQVRLAQTNLEQARKNLEEERAKQDQIAASGSGTLDDVMIHQLRREVDDAKQQLAIQQQNYQNLVNDFTP